MRSRAAAVTEHRYPYNDPYNSAHAAGMTVRGAGTLRQRRPGSWEVRVSVGPDPVSGRAVQRSTTVRGELADAERARALLAAHASQVRAQRQPPLRTVAELLEVWLAAEHDWKPATWQNYRLAVRRLTADPLCRRLPDRLSPPVLRTAMRARQQQGVPLSTIALHVRTLKAALGWAFDERLIASPPLQGMHGPSPCAPRRDVPLDVVRELLTAAEHDVAHAAALPASVQHDRQLHTAEQIRLLLRLAADTGARRGELDALQSGDLHGQVLHIDRGVSAEVVATVLVADGKLLQAQQRLGHAEASTTLRQYCHALPLHDQDVADQLNTLLQHPPPPT